MATSLGEAKYVINIQKWTPKFCVTNINVAESDPGRRDGYANKKYFTTITFFFPIASRDCEFSVSEPFEQFLFFDLKKVGFWKMFIRN